jgi:hypothetical protein
MSITVKAEHVALAGAGTALGLLIFAAIRSAGGLPVPEFAVTESFSGVPDTSAAAGPLFRGRNHIGGGPVVYTGHRYPDVPGGELTTAIHYGHSQLAVPHEKDANWITCPPSEVTI